MRTHENPRPGRIPRVSSLVVLLIVLPAISQARAVETRSSEPAGATTTRSKAVRVYTNADLDRIAAADGKKAPITNAQLKEPLPTQGAPIAKEPSWDFVLEWLDRERAYESQLRQQELDRAAMAAATERGEPPRYYLPGVPYYFTGVPFPPATPPAPMPSNPNLSLHQRGIRTAYDLYKESLRDAQIRRDSLP